MECLYLLEHRYKLCGCDEGKTIGIYSTREKALETIEKYKTIEGFCDHPNDFVIEEYEVDTGKWNDGFIEK